MIAALDRVASVAAQLDLLRVVHAEAIRIVELEHGAVQADDARRLFARGDRAVLGDGEVHLVRGDAQGDRGGGAAQVGGIGIAPGGNINYVTGHAIFEATHGTAPKYANLDKVNPGSVILSGEMMLRHLGWDEAADLVIKGMDGAISAKTVTYDFARMTEGAKEVKCSEFADAVIKHMG